MNNTPEIGGPSCPACDSDNVERIEGGAVGMYRCVNCDEEFDADDDSDHAQSNTRWNQRADRVGLDIVNEFADALDRERSHRFRIEAVSLDGL